MHLCLKSLHEALRADGGEHDDVDPDPMWPATWQSHKGVFLRFLGYYASRIEEWRVERAGKEEEEKEEEEKEKEEEEKEDKGAYGDPDGKRSHAHAEDAREILVQTGEEREKTNKQTRHVYQEAEAHATSTRHTSTSIHIPGSFEATVAISSPRGFHPSGTRHMPEGTGHHIAPNDGDDGWFIGWG